MIRMNESRLPDTVAGWYRLKTEAAGFVDDTRRDYPPCPHTCGHDLCWLDRQWDACPNCNGPLPLALRVDNNFEPLA